MPHALPRGTRALACLCLILTAADLAASGYLFWRLGNCEANPIAAILWHYYGFAGLATLKGAGITVLAGCCVGILPRRPWAVWWLLLATSLLLAGVVGYTLCLYRLL